MGLGRKPKQGYKITYEGNSFVVAPYSIASQIDTYLTAAGYVVATSNFGVGAAATGYPAVADNYLLFSGRYNAVTARYAATSYKNIVIVHEVANDIYYYTNAGYSVSDSVTNTYNNCVSYFSISGLSGVGFTCIFNTATPRNSTNTHANYEPARQNASNKFDTATINGKLRSEFTLPTQYTRIFKSNLAKWNNCILVDCGDDPNFGQIGQWADTIYYNVDEVHPTATMQAQLSDNYYGQAVKLL